MPVFHTKTIESILDPVAQQVSRLVILHEEAEDGNAMPDLSRPVHAVSAAVTNLVRVGRDTINNSDDEILKQDMPSTLYRVENSSQFLEEASNMLKADPYSGPARTKLIDGSRGILQGTSALLLCLDESEVRKIIYECKKVLNYLGIAEVIETMEDLIKFLKDLSPCLSKVSREINARAKELTHHVHSETLLRCLEQIKILTPILICSMKVYVQVIESGGKGANEAANNRNYLVSRISDEIEEIIRILPLTTYDGDASALDILTILKKLSNVVANKMESANDWLANPHHGVIGEKALRQIVENAYKIADQCFPQHAQPIRKMADDISAMTNALIDLRVNGKGGSQQAEALSKEIRSKLGNLQEAISSAVIGVDKANVQQIAHTVQGRLEQAAKWLQNLDGDDKGLGQRAISLIINEGRKVAEGCPGYKKTEILQLSDEIESLMDQLSKLCAAGLGQTPEAQEIARKLNLIKLHELKQKIQDALVNHVVEDFMNVSTPLQQFTEAVYVPEGTQGREQNFNQKANNLQTFSDRASKTSRMVAVGGFGDGNNSIVEGLLLSATQIDSMTPQLISAGRIRMIYPTSKAADDHFNNLKQHYADTVLCMRKLCDQAIDPADFIKMSEEQIQKYTFLCEEAICNGQPQKVVDNASNIARLVSRVFLVAKQEADNSEDPEFIAKLLNSANRLEKALPIMINNAKHLATNVHDTNLASAWRESNKNLLSSVRDVRNNIIQAPEIPTLPDLSVLDLNADHLPPPPPRPPLPQENPSKSPPLPPPPPPLPEVDDEDKVFGPMPHANQPILIAARGLHQEVKQWSSKDNEIIAAANRMAILMAKLSELVCADSKGRKRELIATAKEIVEASENVTRLAKELASQCTDKRIRTNLLQVCERIPTIGTQLKILSTVKATMLGSHDSDEDHEATEMLVGNAQNLMKSVKETVRAAEGASIKIRSDQIGNRLRWVRRQPWYHY